MKHLIAFLCFAFSALACGSQDTGSDQDEAPLTFEWLEDQPNIDPNQIVLEPSMPSPQAAPSGDFGSTEEAEVVNAFPMGVGWSLKGTADPAVAGGYKPITTSFPTVSAFAANSIGPCGWSGAAYQPCALVDTSNRNVTWSISTTTCPSGMSSAEKTRWANGAVLAMNYLNAQLVDPILHYPWTFTQVSTGGELVFDCGTATDAAYLNNKPALAATGAAGTLSYRGQVTKDSNGNLPAIYETCDQPENAGYGVWPGLYVYPDEIWLYHSGHVAFSPTVFDSWVNSAVANGYPAFGSADYTNAVAHLLAHEALHFLGAQHTLWTAHLADPVTGKPIYGQSDDIMWMPPQNGGLNRTAARQTLGTYPIPSPLIQGLLDLDMTEASSKVTPLDDDLSCLGVAAAVTDGPADKSEDAKGGYQLAYNGSSRVVMGSRTGNGHTACDETSTGQVCTFSGSRVIHYCGLNNIFHSKTLLGGFTFNDQWDDTLKLPDGYQGVYHSSCDDPEVNLVVNEATCPGTGSTNVDNVVCWKLFDWNGNLLQSPPFLNLAAGFAGSWFDWTSTGWAELDLDTSEIASYSPGGTFHERFAHALNHGIYQLLGIGSQSATPGMFSSSQIVTSDSAFIGVHPPFSYKQWVTTQESRFFRNFALTDIPNAATFVDTQ